MTWKREPREDRRFAWGDQFAGDAWVDEVTGQIRYTAVGQKLSESANGLWRYAARQSGQPV